MPLLSRIEEKKKRKEEKEKKFKLCSDVGNNFLHSIPAGLEYKVAKVPI